ncbi:MAG: pentapeptide repeat-containing protein [Anaerolineaceae bacterium]
MKEKIQKYLDGIFAPYEGMKTVGELKEELSNNLSEKWNDLKTQGHDDETAYRMTIDSIGDVSEILETISTKTHELKQAANMDLSKINLQNSDFRGVQVHDGKFNYSDLKGSDFSGADLTNSSFKGADLSGVNFAGADLSGVKFVMANLKDAGFTNCILENTEFNMSDLVGACFDNLTLNGTSFEKSSIKGASFRNAFLKNVSFHHAGGSEKAYFDGVTMDKLTYAVLKGQKADLSKVNLV